MPAIQSQKRSDAQRQAMAFCPQARIRQAWRMFSGSARILVPLHSGSDAAIVWVMARARQSHSRGNGSPALEKSHDETVVRGINGGGSQFVLGQRGLNATHAFPRFLHITETL